MDSDQTRGHPRILLVEDEPAIRELMGRVLDSEDHWQPTTVCNGADAVEAWDKSEFDLILMDLRLPVMDGIEATRQIRERERLSGRKRIPIIAFSAAVSEADRQACIEAGIDYFIAKPASMQDVISAIYDHLP